MSLVVMSLDPDLRHFIRITKMMVTATSTPMAAKLPTTPPTSSPVLSSGGLAL